MCHHQIRPEGVQVRAGLELLHEGLLPQYTSLCVHLMLKEEVLLAAATGSAVNRSSSRLSSQGLKFRALSCLPHGLLLLRVFKVHSTRVIWKQEAGAEQGFQVVEGP